MTWQITPIGLSPEAKIIRPEDNEPYFTYLQVNGKMIPSGQSITVSPLDEIEIVAVAKNIGGDGYLWLIIFDHESKLPIWVQLRPAGHNKIIASETIKIKPIKRPLNIEVWAGHGTDLITMDMIPEYLVKTEVVEYVGNRVVSTRILWELPTKPLEEAEKELGVMTELPMEGRTLVTTKTEIVPLEYGYNLHKILKEASPEVSAVFRGVDWYLYKEKADDKL